MKIVRSRVLTALCVAASMASLFGVASAEAQTRIKQGKDGHRSAFAREPEKRVPLEKHDLILILVREESQGDVGADLDSKRKSELNLLIDSFVKLEGGHLEPDEGPFPEVELEAEAKTKASGKTKRQDRIRARITARVVDVLDNGNIRVEARRERQINAELTIITLSGEARPEDVSADHQLLSDRLADLKLSYSGAGPVSGRTGYSWLSRVVDWIWPF